MLFSGVLAGTGAGAVGSSAGTAGSCAADGLAPFTSTPRAPFACGAADGSVAPLTSTPSTSAVGAGAGGSGSTMGASGAGGDVLTISAQLFPSTLDEPSVSAKVVMGEVVSAGGEAERG